jgi:hypothetical protein
LVASLLLDLINACLTAQAQLVLVLAQAEPGQDPPVACSVPEVVLQDQLPERDQPQVTGQVHWA